MDRRDALKAFAAIAVTGSAREATVTRRASARPADMIYRALGRTGEKVSAIGLGGHHIGRPREAAEGIRIIRSAIDRGITFLDNCWDYHDGESERRMGDALRDGYRKRVFLMTKFDGRTKAATASQIDESLKRLQTDIIDLMQYHENIRMEDPDRFFAPAGPLEALLEAKKAGKIRYIGFTGHKDPAVHVRMLDVAAAHGFQFDSCQMPLNVMDAHFRSFEQQVLPRLVREGDRRARHEADGRWIRPQKRSGDPTRVPALRAQPADVGRHHRLREHGAARSGARGRADVSTDEPGRRSRRFCERPSPRR